MKRLVWMVLISISVVLPSRAEKETVRQFDAATVMQRMLAHRGKEDFSLRARLFVSRNETLDVEMLVRNSTNETRTLFRSGKSELLVIQPVAGETRWFLRGTGELKGARLRENWLGSQFTYYDLGTPFLRWPNPKSIGEGRVRGQDCYTVELTAEGQPYRRVRLAVEQRFFALLRVEAFDEKDGLVRRISITSFKRLGDLWLPRGIDIAFVPPNQALPAEEKSRLEIYDGNYAAHLPAELFAEP